MQEMNELKQYFLNDIRRRSEEEIEKLKQEQDAARERAISEIREEAKREAEMQLDQELKEITAEYTVKNSKIDEERNRKLMLKRDEMTSSIFEEVTCELQKFVKTNAYVQHLNRQIKGLGIDSSGVVFYISQQDEQRKKEIFQGIANADVRVDHSIAIGGFRMEDEREGIVVDETLDMRLEDEKNWFYANSSLAIR